MRSRSQIVSACWKCRGVGHAGQRNHRRPGLRTQKRGNNRVCGSKGQKRARFLRLFRRTGTVTCRKISAG